MKKIALLGSTGSVGMQVLEVVRRHETKFRITALAANSMSSVFKKQIKEFRPKVYAAASEDRSEALSIAEFADADIIFNAVGGFAGLEYSVRAIRAGKTLALANKETLVCGGDYIMRLAEANKAEIIPVDSEHSAIWQCLNYDRKTPFKRLILTASGGAFRGYTSDMLEKVTPAQALTHPTWKMGEKITVDSATMLNKGYEVIEAHHLYKAPYNKIDVVIQPSSTVHSLVEFADGAVMAQLGSPDMQVPIQLALTYPKRLPSDAKPLNFKDALSLEFIPLKRKEYPLFDLAVQCGKDGGTLPCALNAADEVAVKAFLDGKIGFNDIYKITEKVVSSTASDEIAGFKQLEEVDRSARWKAQKLVYKITK